MKHIKYVLLSVPVLVVFSAMGTLLSLWVRLSSKLALIVTGCGVLILFLSQALSGKLGKASHSRFQTTGIRLATSIVATFAFSTTLFQSAHYVSDRVVVQVAASAALCVSASLYVYAIFKRTSVE